MFWAILVAAGFGLTNAAGPRSATLAPDSLDAIGHVRYLLGHYYQGGMRPEASPLSRRRFFSGGSPDGRCDADRGDECFGGDPDAGPCPNFVSCHRDPSHMVDVLEASAKQYPSSGYLTGQAVYALTKEDRLPEAMKVADGCTASAWWCDALRGYVLHAQGKDVEADSAYRSAMATAPDSIACRWTDATWLLGTLDQRGSPLSTVAAHDAASGWSCARLMAVSDSIWWLSDPLYSVRGNDRWVEHLARFMSARFYDEIRHAYPGSLGTRQAQEHVWADRIRRGPPDSYDLGQGWRWTSVSAAQYHFIPEVTLNDLTHPTWSLEANLDDEGYAPSYAPVVPLPQQTARFRAGDSLRVAVAGRLEGTHVAGALDAAASLVLSGGPDQVPVILNGDAHQPVVRFLGAAPDRRYVASLEVVTSKGVAWARHVLASLDVGGPEVSDLLLYDTSGATDEPATLDSAAARMRPSAAVAKGGRVGVYWETYGAPAGATLEFDLSVERRAGGLVDRLSRLLPGGNQQGPGRITWTEPAGPGPHTSAVALGLGGLDNGDYTLILRVGWDGRQRLERRRDITIG